MLSSLSSYKFVNLLPINIVSKSRQVFTYKCCFQVPTGEVGVTVTYYKTTYEVNGDNHGGCDIPIGHGDFGNILEKLQYIWSPFH